MTMKKNFTTGMLSGICGILVVLLIMGTTTAETTTKFEFHDLGDTRGLIFDKTTGEMKYKEIRIEPLPNPLDNVTISGYLTLDGGLSGFHIRN